MPLGEFELIDRFFARLGARRGDVVLGVGDDAALLRVPDGSELVASIDTFVEGSHFLPGAHGDDVGWRVLAANLSDLAAMGATPAWATLALTLPAVDEDWLDDFARGFGALAEAHGVALVGGDTTRGPLTITVQIMGHASAGRALRRAGAQPGDLVYVTGWVGDSAAGLAIEQGRLGGQGANRSYLVERFRRPEPRVAFGQRLHGIASACIDVSDGVACDAGRIARASGCGIVLRASELPLSRALFAVAGESRAREFALGGGEDFELLFTVPPARRAALAAQLGAGAPACHCIGEVVAGKGVRVLGERGDLPVPAGWDHFAK